MRLEHDPEADAVYVWFSEQAVALTRTVENNRSDAAVDFARDGSVVGVELLGVRHGIDLHGCPREADLVALLIAAGFVIVRRASG